jgi:hypothetical protein
MVIFKAMLDAREFCAQSCLREKQNVQRVISIPVSCSIFKILPPEDCHVQGLSCRTKHNALTIFKAGLDATA